MPLYYFLCTGCGNQSRRILSATAASSTLECKECHAPLQRTPKPPTTRVVETLDNHVMGRKLEREADAERLYRDRSKSDPRNNHKDDDIV